MKKINYCFLFVIILSAPVTIFTSTLNIDEVMSRANRYYLENDYTSAISEYEKLISEGYTGVSLFYNLGNAYYRIGKLGYSILYYEKALKLSPNDEDVKHNLAIANLRTKDKIDALPKFFLFEWWETFLSVLSLQSWVIFSIIIYLLLIAAIAFYFFFGNIINQRVSFFSGVIILFILLISVSIVTIKLNRDSKRLEGVIVDNSVVVKLAPNDQGKDGFIIHEGLKILIEDEVDNWNKIRLADGKVGWVNRSQLRII